MIEKLGKTNKGITLIALVITIIVLLILAGVTIATLTGDNGILSKVETAKMETDEGKIVEEIKLGYNAVKIGSNLNGWNKDTESAELETELTNMNQTDEIIAYKENLKDGNEVIIVEYVNRDKIYCIDDNSEIHECEIEYFLGDIQQETLDNGEYAIFTLSSAGANFILCDSDPNYDSLPSTNKGEKIEKNMIWNVETEDDKLLLYTISQGTKQYIYRTNLFNGYGYKIDMKDTEFYWNYKWDTEDQNFRVDAKVLNQNYALRYYNSKTGWIVTTRGMGIVFVNIDKEFTIIN